MASGRANKYGARKTTVDGITFHSKRESERYVELKLREKAGEIYGLRCQPRFPLRCGGRLVRYASGRQAVYIADFEYVERPPDDLRGQPVIEDVKGHSTQLSKLKVAVFEAETGLRVHIVR